MKNKLVLYMPLESLPVDILILIFGNLTFDFYKILSISKMFNKISTCHQDEIARLIFNKYNYNNTDEIYTFAKYQMCLKFNKDIFSKNANISLIYKHDKINKEEEFFDIVFAILLLNKKINFSLLSEVNISSLLCWCIWRTPVKVHQYMCKELNIDNKSNVIFGRLSIQFAATYNNLEMVEYLLPDARCESSAIFTESFMTNLLKGDKECFDIVSYLIKKTDFTITYYNSIFCKLASLNKFRIADFIMKRFLINLPIKHKAIKLAAHFGNLDFIKLLLLDPMLDPSILENIVLRKCVSGAYKNINDYIEIVILLLKDSRVDPSAVNNEAICTASRHNYVEIVKLLLVDSRVNKHVNNDYCLKIAIKENYVELIELLS